MKLSHVPAIILGCFALISLGCQKPTDSENSLAPQETHKKEGSAVALLKPTGANTPLGTVTFTEVPGGVRVVALLTAVPPGDHGFHVHQRGDCRGNGDSALGHFNPDNSPHGLPDSSLHHVGDLGNITANAAGRAVLDRVFPDLELKGAHSIIGRGLILHANPDNGGQPTGNAGARLACAEILPPQKHGAASLQPTTGNLAQGEVRFIQLGKGVLVIARFSGVPAGTHGFHIHEFGDCRSGDGLSAGGHFNPLGVDHGLPGSPTLHMGDLGNVTADAGGEVKVVRIFTHFSLQGPYSVMGRGVILHANTDNGGQPTGNAGARLACGAIEP